MNRSQIVGRPQTPRLRKHITSYTSFSSTTSFSMVYSFSLNVLEWVWLHESKDQLETYCIETAEAAPSRQTDGTVEKLIVANG